MHISVTAMATDKAVTTLSVATNSQWCTHRCYTNVNIAVTELSMVTAVRALSVPPLSQRSQLSPMSH